MINFIVEQRPDELLITQHAMVEFDQGIKGVPSVDPITKKVSFIGKVEKRVFDYIDPDDNVPIPPKCIYAARWDGKSPYIEIIKPLPVGYERQHVFAGWPTEEAPPEEEE